MLKAYVTRLAFGRREKSATTLCIVALQPRAQTVHSGKQDTLCDISLVKAIAYLPLKIRYDDNLLKKGGGGAHPNFALLTEQEFVKSFDWSAASPLVRTR